MSDNDTREVTYLAEYGDWVVVDGRPATVTRAQPYFNTVNGEYGTYYDLMYQGGAESVVYHAEGADTVYFRYHGGSPDRHVSLTVVDQAKAVVEVNG